MVLFGIFLGFSIHPILLICLVSGRKWCINDSFKKTFTLCFILGQHIPAYIKTLLLHIKCQLMWHPTCAYLVQFQFLDNQIMD